MLIKTKYIDCASKSVFNTWKLPTSAADTSGDIYWSAVVYIKDTGEVWTHGKLYGGFFSNADNNKVSLTIGGTTKILALDGHVQSYTTLTGSGSIADQAILSTGEANKWTLKTLGKNAFSNVDYLPADATAVAAEKVVHALAFQYNGKAIHSFDGSVARVLNIIQGDNVFITEDSQGNVTIAADPGSDTVNTAGATNKVDTKLFLIGAESQTTAPQTYSNQYVYIGTDNCLYSLGKKVLTEHQAIYNLDLQTQVGEAVTKVTTFDPNAANNSFTLVQGTNVTLTPDAANKKVTISSKDTTYDFYNLVFKQGESVIDTYKPTTSPSKTLKAGTNVTFTGSNNEVLITTQDTRNTAGATEKLTTKLFLTGALTQTDNPQTYTNSKVYIGADNKLYSDGKVVSTGDHTHPIYVTLDTEQTINGSKTFTTPIISTVASGTAPFRVASNTLVTNLNADRLDNLHENSFLRYRDTVTTQVNTLWAQIGIRQYNNAKPDGMANPIYNYGAVISLPGANTRLDIWYNHTSSASDSSTNGIQYRSGWGTDKKPWRMLLDSVNAKHYNVGSATKLQTARQINGTNFDGTANIVTSYWGTARNFTIGNTTRSVNGSGNVSWSFADIGGAPASHSHNYINSRGNLNPQTGRTQNLGDVYSYNTVSGTSNGAPTTYTSVIGFGRSTGGTVEIAGGWTAGMGLWYRALGDTTDNWYGWIKVWDTRNFDPNSKANSNHNHDGSYITKGGSNNNVVLGAGGYRALSDFTLNSNWAASKDVSGYVKFPNGFIIQWGEAYVGANSTGHKSFPIAFPTACISVQVTHKTTAINWDKVCVAGNYTRTSCTIANCETVNSLINWMALGY